MVLFAKVVISTLALLPFFVFIEKRLGQHCISTEKRDEILANCQTEDERLRTAELIRPILRGRDIKRYGYNWADLWLIATFPSRHYKIEEFPAVKAHLLSFGKERLEQTGKKYIEDLP